MGSWLAARLATPPRTPTRGGQRALAVDGKSLRGTRHASGDGQAIHLLAACDQQASAVLGQAAMGGKTNECVWPGGHPGEMKWSGSPPGAVAVEILER